MLTRIAMLTAALCVIAGSEALAAGSQNSEYIQYPSFGDRVPQANTGRVEMAHDKGLIVELTVRCGVALVGLVTFSKVERIYCTPTHRCGPTLSAAIWAVCH